MDNPSKSSDLLKQNKVTKVSYYTSVTSNLSRPIELDDIFEMIRTGKGLKDIITALRKESDNEKAGLIKKKLPSVTFAGIFKGRRRTEFLAEYSQLICLDFDKLTTLPNARKRLCNDPFVYCLFTSPSGNGLKVIVRVTSHASQHSEAFGCLQAYFLKKYNLQADLKCKDITRLCFLSHDPDIYVNEKCEIFSVEPLAIEQFKDIKKKVPRNNLSTDVEIVVRGIEERGLDITEGYDKWLQLGFALAEGLGEDGREFFHRLSRLHPRYSVCDTNKQYDNCLKGQRKGISLNTLFYLAKQNGIDINILNDQKISIRNDSNTNMPLKISTTMKSDIVFYSPVFDKQQNIVDIKINYTKLNELLLSFGFRRFDIENDFIIVKIDKNIIEEVNVTTIQDTVFKYIESLPDVLANGITKEMIVEKFNKSPETYFSKKRYSLLRPERPYHFVRDTKDNSYVFYKNGFVQCSADGWQLRDYKDLDGFIWRNQIHDRQFHSQKIDANDIEKLGVFARFVWNISNKNKERFSSIQSIMGYILHTYFEDKLKSVILTDSKISDFPDGRTGKSLLTNGLGKMKKMCNIKGKNFKSDNKFKYQEVSLDDQIVTIDDAAKDFDFEMMFNDITEGIGIEKKNTNPFTIKAKIVITTNRTLKIEGASAKDRSIEFELSDHYNENYSPKDEFSKWFFGSDFSEEDWTLFDNFLMSCISHYLSNGVIKPLTINLNRRKLLESTNPDFLEFMDSQVEAKAIQPDCEYLKKDLHDLFLKEYPDYLNDRFLSRLRTFTQYLKLYAKYTEGFAEVKKEDERKSNDKRYIKFRPDKEET